MDLSYVCLDSSGKEIRGVMSAVGPAEARSVLKKQGLTVLDIVEEEEKKGKKSFFKKGITDDDIYNMSRELSILLKSGVTIDKAFGILRGSVTNEQLKERISEILKDIKAGRTVAQAFADSGAFNTLTTTMIYAGESIGDLRSAFENIAQHMNFQIRFKSEIRNALTYPIFLIFASLVTLLVIFKFIIPRFFSIFAGGQVTLPFSARILYSIANVVNAGSIYFLAGGAVALVVAWKTLDFRKVFNRAYSYLIFVPLLRNLILYLELSRFSYSMYSMLNSGVEFIHALRLSTGIIQHREIKGALEPAVNQIKEGKGIADVFSQVRFLPEMVPSMLRVGEGSGNLKEIFFELHHMFDERFKNNIKKVLVLIEPAVITVTGIIVGFIVISLIMMVMSVGNVKL